MAETGTYLREKTELPTYLHGQAGLSTSYLREKAEEKFASLTDNSVKLSSEDIRDALHELRIHQIELEMQNDELNRTQADLGTAVKRYCDLYDMAPVGYCTLNENAVLLEANRTIADMLGLERRKLVRQKITLFIHREDRNIYYLHREKLFGTGELQICELRMVKQDGTIFYAHIEAKTAEDEYGESMCRMVISDITREKRLQEQLNQAQKMESVGRFAGGVAHGFNNLLSALLGYTDMAMEKAGLSEPLFDDLMEIRKAVVCSADFTRQLLTFARQLPIVSLPIDLNGTIENALTMLRSLTGENIELVWKPGAGIWQIEMDTLQLDQILVDLCVNAREHLSGWDNPVNIRRDGRITIQTMTRTFDEAWCREHYGCVSGDHVVIEVSNNGRGMERKTRENIFEPFADTSKREVLKTGLGLATLHGIVKQNNGFIEVCSEPKKGTVFTIYLPRYMPSPDMQEKGQVKSGHIKPVKLNNKTNCYSHPEFFLK